MTPILFLVTNGYSFINSYWASETQERYEAIASLADLVK